MSGDSHVINDPAYSNSTTSSQTSGYNSIETPPSHRHEYTPPVVPPNYNRNHPHPLTPPEPETGDHGYAAMPRPPPDTLPQQRQHYSQPVPPPTQPNPHAAPTPVAPNYTAPVPKEPDSMPTWGSNFPPGGGREGSISPQLQRANIPGYGPVLIYQIMPDVGPYMYPSQSSPALSHLERTNNATYNGTQTRFTNAQQQGSPLLPSPRTGRSYSQPAVQMHRYRKVTIPVNAPDGDGGIVLEEVGVEEEGGRGNELRRFTSPNSGQLESYRQNVLSSLRKTSAPLREDSTLTENTQNCGGYDLKFLSPREELQDLVCPICQLIMCQPHLTDCCGACFCQSCIHYHIDSGGQCPICNRAHYSTFIDRNRERTINRLQVQCPHEHQGCKWVGPLHSLSGHTDLMVGDCQYIFVACSYCNRDISLNKLQDHKINECQRRPYSCKFCSYKGIYGDMPNHWQVCDGYPIACPNGCGQMDMPRRELRSHLEECPKRPMECELKFAGCHASFSLADAQRHREDSAHHHIFLLCELVKKLMIRQKETTPTPDDSFRAELEKRISEGERERAWLTQELQSRNKEIKNLQKEIESLQEENDEIRSDVTKMRACVFTPPFHFTVSHFSELRASGKQWFSQPFYSHSQGYRMCISMDCNGTDEGSGTHVSVYANLMRGEFDDDLNWPFNGVVMVQLLNQYSTLDKGNIVHEIPFSRDVPPEIGGRVVDQELAESGLGVPQFVAHAKLNFDRYTNVGYLKGDSLCFCVTSVRRFGVPG